MSLNETTREFIQKYVCPLCDNSCSYQCDNIYNCRIDFRLSFSKIGAGDFTIYDWCCYEGGCDCCRLFNSTLAAIIIQRKFRQVRRVFAARKIQRYWRENVLGNPYNSIGNKIIQLEFEKFFGVGEIKRSD